MNPWHTTPTGLRLTVWAQPGAKKTAITGLHGGAIKIQLAARPVEGAANEALIRFLAETFHVPKRSVSLVKGEQQRQKVLEILGPPEPLQACLIALLGD